MLQKRSSKEQKLRTALAEVGATLISFNPIVVRCSKKLRKQVAEILVDYDVVLDE